MASHKERMLAGDCYLADDEELHADRHRCLGDETEILSPFFCDYGYQIEVGSRTFINFGAVILDSAPIRIGDDVQIGPGVQLVTPTHPLDPERRRPHRSSRPSVIWTCSK